MPLISIVIPSYNRANRLIQTIESVQAQSFRDWEIILVDDGSTDNTSTLVAALEDSRIKYFYKENGERGAARNFGIDRAMGEYIFFLDSDDLIKPGYLEELHRLIQKYPEACLHIPYNLMRSGKEETGPTLVGNLKSNLEKQNRFACQVTVPKKYLNAVRFSENREFKIGEDWYFVLQLLDKYPFIVSEKRLGLIVQHESRSMNEVSAEAVLASCEIFIAELLRTLPHRSDLVKNVKHELINLASLQASIYCERRHALKLLFQSLRYRPFRVFRFRNFVILKKCILGR